MKIARRSFRWVAAVLAMAALITIVFVVTHDSRNVQDAHRLTEAIKKDSRFTSVRVYNTTTGHIVMVVAPEDLPAPDRPVLDELVKRYTDQGVIYGMSSLPHAAP